MISDNKSHGPLSMEMALGSIDGTFMRLWYQSRKKAAPKLESSKSLLRDLSWRLLHVSIGMAGGRCAIVSLAMLEET